ncbi:alpha/beta fold hydrolase [Nocardia beijingensis]|uniref:alpha/beta fold hydrolase n=1 Tax=Nocardia beijingensis TaxID=95162 RepID=UPI0018936864|nr:alpha/beta hydrolase [Nocardia beijingensis]MBF6074735.1 alpha/beta hydrolase [Nocardia beijingensis]
MTNTRRVRRAVAALALALAATVSDGPAQAQTLPTVVLVHGAFADTTSWDGVAAVLRERGYRVLTPENPLRGPAYDAAAVQRTLDAVSGPVVLAGHSYGGFVISNIHDPKVESLVYIAAFAPVEGEVAQAALDPIRFPGSQLLPPALQVKVVDDATGVAGKNLDGYVAPDSFNAVFAQDVDPATAADMIAHQHSIALKANLEPSGSPSWPGTPSWYLISGADRVIPPSSQRFMAQRMAARTSEIDASHASLVSRPDVVAAVIDAAVPR